MKSALLLFLFLTTLRCLGQDISELNKQLRFSDTLEYKKEIRIYKKHSTTDTSKIFRMYDAGNNNWIVKIISYSDIFKCITKIEEIGFPKKDIGNLKPKNANLIWLNLLLCDIEFLPNLKAIEYKLKDSSIELEDGEYGIFKKIKRPLDGEIYEVFIKNGKIKNHFIFDNPESYLKHYSNVDELLSYNKIVNTIKEEFNIWTE